MAETTTEVYGPQRRYAEKQMKLGMVKISAWVPEAKRDDALAYLTNMRMKATKEATK